MNNQSKNVSSVILKLKGLPDNQQERLKMFGWITGFVDGEGSFSISIFRNKKAQLSLGWQVFPEFVVTQGEKSLKVLEEMKIIFGCGSIYKAGYKKNDNHNDNHKEPLYRYCVRARVDLREIIIPFFQENYLRTAKKNDFDKIGRAHV